MIPAFAYAVTRKGMVLKNTQTLGYHIYPKYRDARFAKDEFGGEEMGYRVQKVQISATPLPLREKKGKKQMKKKVKYDIDYVYDDFPLG